MRASVVLAGVALTAGCVDDQWYAQATDTDVITELTIVPKTGERVPADGRSRMTVTLKTAGEKGRDQSLKAVLIASDGKWDLGDAGNSKQLTLTNIGPVETAELIAGTTPGVLVVQATVADRNRLVPFTLSPVEDSDVFESFTITPPPGGAVADGTTPLTVEVCATDAKAAEPMAAVDIRTSDGTWIGGTGADTALIQLPLAGGCATALLKPGVTPKTVVVTATIGRFVRAQTATLAPAAIESMLCSVSGTISSSTGGGTLTVTARLFAANGGQPSLGTRVEFHGTVEPSTAGGNFGRPTAVLDAGNSVTSEYVVYGHPTRLTLGASFSASLACTDVTVGPGN